MTASTDGLREALDLSTQALDALEYPETDTLRSVRELGARAIRTILAELATLRTDNLALVNQVAAEAHARGEAEGRLRASETAGIVEGCQRRAEAAEARIIVVETERDEALREHTDMMWQRRRADERAEAAEAEVERLEIAALHSRDFQAILARLIHRHSKEMDITETVASARDLLARKGSLSPLRDADPIAQPQVQEASHGE